MKQKLDQIDKDADVNPYETVYETSDDERTPTRAPTQAKNDKSELNKLQDQIFKKWPSDDVKGQKGEKYDDEVSKSQRTKSPSKTKKDFYDHPQKQEKAKPMVHQSRE